MPALGYRTYRIRKGAIELAPLPTSETRIENEYLLFEVDPASGRIAKLVLKATGVDLAAPASKHAVVVDDPSDTWGHGVRAYDREIGEFACERTRLVETGPVRSILRVESRYGSSTLREDYVLAAGAAYVDVRVTLDWHEQLKLLKLRYPTSVVTQTATFETPYGHLERPSSGDEEPGQSWVDVSGRRPRADRDQRRQGRLRRSWRRHRDQRRPQPRLGLARSPRARGRRRLQLHGSGPPGLSRKAHPPRGRLARRRCG